MPTVLGSVWRAGVEWGEWSGGGGVGGVWGGVVGGGVGGGGGGVGGGGGGGGGGGLGGGRGGEEWGCAWGYGKRVGDMWCSSRRRCEGGSGRFKTAVRGGCWWG